MASILAKGPELGDITVSVKLDYRTSVRDLATELICGLTSGQLVWLVTQVCLSVDDERRGELLVAIRETLGKE